jgi:hypothetical protein
MRSSQRFQRQQLPLRAIYETCPFTQLTGESRLKTDKMNIQTNCDTLDTLTR